MNYPKFVLKDKAELEALLADKDNLFVVSCNKCFKEIETTEEPEAAEFTAMAAELGKKVTGAIAVDFLCNSVQTEKKLADAIPEGTDYLVIISCGLGIQSVANQKDIPVVAATNSLNYIGSHGMALTAKTCDACAQCYLNLTGGICPIVDCTKSLLNGQCGGAKKGKCEIDPKKDCAWENIYQRLEKQGRNAAFIAQPIQLRDYSKINHKVISNYVAAQRAMRSEGWYGGVHPAEGKELAEHFPVKKFPAPCEVVIPTSMHVGAPATPVVAVGDAVKVGQLIAEAPSFISANVHSSVSGVVTAVEPRLHSNGKEVVSIVIKNDGKDEVHESVVACEKTLDELTKEEIVEIVKEKGITGMGGAGFPTYVKLQPGKPIDYVLINGSECEPMLTADHRAMLEMADDVIYGLKAVMKAVDAPKGIIVVENNKPDAIEVMKAAVADLENIEVCEAATQYPQGAEKMIIKRAVGRAVPSGKLPADVGCVVANISTVIAISNAIQKGMPPVERIVTITGSQMASQGNYMVKIGTPVKNLINFAGGVVGDDVTLKMGGPMMGAVLTSTDVPVIKGTNGVIAIPTDHTETVTCLKCGRCADVCPMELVPMNFAKNVDAGNAQALLDAHIMDCFQCRCCEYICAAKIPLVSKIGAGKTMVMELKK